jgi:hypothetical protein
VYGTDIYTSDSHLATASVHCGTLKYGEKGVVKVTIMPGRASYEGSERHGVSSSQWTTWGASFKIEPLKPANTEKTENK